MIRYVGRRLLLAVPTLAGIAHVSRWLAVLVVALMMVTRVYLADHWPSDVLGGLLLGILPHASREVLMLAGNPETRTRLERVGVTVREFAGREICLKGGGGPTCLTRPLLRDGA